MSNESGFSSAMAPLKVLLLSSLFPSDARPRHGIFVETRMQHLRADCPADVRVIAPVPWFPFRARCFGRYADFAATPRQAVRGSVPVSYPRYVMLPRLGVSFQPDSMALAAERALARLVRSGWVPDLIDAHYFYPDGVAAALIGERLGLPVVVTARGSDIHLLAGLPGPAARIHWAAQRAAAVVAVSTRLRDALVQLGADPERVSVLRNGVDTGRFPALERMHARRQLELPPDGPLAACVGNLVPEKGQALAIEALHRLPGWRLLVVGDGPLRGELESLGRRIGVADRVIFRKTMPQAALHQAYSAADVLVLPSHREGWPNVVLEALACGTPVVATDVGAVRDMLTGDAFGRVLSRRDPGDLANQLAQVVRSGLSRDTLRAHAAGFDWKRVSLGQWQVFQRAVGNPAWKQIAGTGAVGGVT